jgi:hypothetical protein
MTLRTVFKPVRKGESDGEEEKRQEEESYQEEEEVSFQSLTLKKAPNLTRSGLFF